MTLHTSIQHKRSARYEIMLNFVKHSFGQKDDNARVEYYRELLVYDYYLRENAKTRPPFAGEYLLGKEEVRKFYEEEAVSRKFLCGYEEYDKNQMRKMTHLEYFPVLEKTVLFDYMHRNPLSYEAYTYEL